MSINGITNGARPELTRRITEAAAQLDIVGGTMSSGRPSAPLVQAFRVSREGLAVSGLRDGHAGVAALRAAMDTAATSPGSHAAASKLATAMSGLAHLIAALPRA